MEAMRLKSWAPGGRPRHPVAGAAGQMSGYHRWGASHIRFPPHGEVIIPALSLCFFSFFDFELEEACVWKSSVLIRETHSVSAIL